MSYLVLCFLLIAPLFLAGKCDNDPTTPNALSESYFPTTIGSYWKVVLGEKRFTMTITGDSTIDGTTYKVVSVPKTSGLRNLLLREADGYIYLWDSKFRVASPAVKINAALGETWSFPFTVDGVEKVHEYTMIARDATKTVQGKTYTNVLHVQLSNYTFHQGEKILEGKEDSYFAKGVGMIYVRFPDGSEWSVEDYHIQ